MKTAMQELIEYIELNIDDNDFIKHEVLEQADKLIEKEKDAIIIAWNDSKISIMNGEQYFEETYNQKNL
jgi:UDP-N-acetyl-D-mannosaminuronic acid transferase (WecB/TagA/CpsF family)